MAQVQKSKVMNNLKTKLKGAWKEARKVEPKARGGGGLPPSLKNAVAVCKTYKMDQTEKGDPYFMLGVVVKEPEDIAGRLGMISWFINDSEYQTVEEAAANLANDLGLMLPDQELPEDEEGILEAFKELCERGVHILINTGRERKGGRSPNIFVQGLAEGWEDEPQDGAGEHVKAGGSTKASPPTKKTTKPPVEDEPVEDEPVEETEEAVEEDEGTEDEVYIPQKGDVYNYKAPKTKEAEEYVVQAVDEENEKVTLKQKTPAKGQKAKVFSGVAFSKLG